MAINYYRCILKIIYIAFIIISISKKIEAA